MISQSAEYALRAAVCLASHPAERLSTARVAEETRVPAGYLAKVLQALARRGLVTSIPGRSGGFVLAREPAAISVLDVVNAVEPVRRIDSCPLGRTSHTSLCPLHRRLDEAAATVEKAFADTSLAEILSDPSSVRPLCESVGSVPT